jgi:hypothetical protein
MRLLLPIATLALAALAAAAPVHAQGQYGVQDAAQENKACEVLASNDSWDIRTRLSTFQTDVLGRNTIDWTARDFDRILSAARACDGYQSKKQARIVWTKDWEDQMTSARNLVMPVVEGFAQAVRQATETPRDQFKVPSCVKILDWRFENISFASNAGNLFGAHLFELSSKDLRAISRFASDCANPLTTYAIGRFQIPQERVLGTVNRMVEVMNTVATAREAYDKSPKRANDVVAKLDGYDIPPGLAHERMQIVIRRFNQLNIRGGGMSADAISELQQGIEQVLNRSDISNVDQAFADAIRGRINSDIFSFGGESSPLPARTR